jgi:SseB protein N-terminal domain
VRTCAAHPGGPYRRVGHVSGHLNPGGQQFREDRGAADPRVTEALAAYQCGQGSEQSALGALAAARLLVPVIAVLADGAVPGQGDKNSEMVLPKLIGRDGRLAVLAFTGLDALARWRPDARPVPAEADRVWRAAVAEDCAVVIDVAGPVPLAVEGARLAALAAGQPAPPPYEDPDVRAEVQAAIAAEPAIAGFSLAPGRAGHTDLAVTLYLAKTRARTAPKTGPAQTGPAQTGPAQTGPAQTGPAVNRAAAGLAARLGTRLRRGIEVVIAE